MKKIKKYPLMKNNFSRSDLDEIINYLKQKDPILTSNKIVVDFEKKWSKWLGVKYSVFVNSGSSANLISLTVLKNKFPKGGEIIVPPLTWVSDIVSIIQSGFTPIFVDIKMENLSLDSSLVEKAISNKTVAIFLSHIQGFNGLDNKILSLIKKHNIILIEDVCESHGAMFKNKKCGSYGLMSNFSFYYAHHISTIEGGMVCTNDKKIYLEARMIRAHGLLRESNDKKIIKSFQKKYNYLNPDYIFLYAGFNMRNTEIGGMLGRSQLKRLDKIIEKRNKNHEYFLKKIDSSKYFIDFLIKGSSNYAFNLILRNKDRLLLKRLKIQLKKNNIEFRQGSAGGGNQLLQPYLRNLRFRKKINFPIVEHIHTYGFYIGNYPSLSFKDIDFICKIINSA